MYEQRFGSFAVSEFWPWILGMEIFESLQMKDKEDYRDRELQHIHALTLFFVYVFNIINSYLCLYNSVGKSLISCRYDER